VHAGREAYIDPRPICNTLAAFLLSSLLDLSPRVTKGGGIDARARRSPIGNRSDTVLRLPTFVPCLPPLVPPVIPIRVIDTSTLPTSGAGVKRRRGRHEPGGDEATPRLRPRAYKWERRSREASLFPSPVWQTPAGLPGRLNGLKTPLTEHALAAGRLPAHAAAGTHTPRLHRAQPVSSSPHRWRGGAQLER